MSAREIRDLLQRELTECGVRLDVPLLPQNPFVIPKSSYLELFRAGRALLDLLKKAVLAAGESRAERLAAIGGSEADYPVFSSDDRFEERYCDLMARPDVVIGPDGPKFLEFNVSGTFGGTSETHLFTRVWERVHGDRDASGLWGFDPYEARAATLYAVRDELGVPPAVAVIGSRRDIPGANSSRYFDLEVQHLRRRGFRAMFFEPEEIFDGLGLPESLDYPLGLRYFNVADWRAHGIDFAPVRAAVAAGWRLVPSQSCGMLANKRVLAWLSAGRPWMTEAERELAGRYLPWTREVGDRKVTWRGEQWDLPTLLLSARESFALKAATGMMGRTVLLGPRTAPAAWAEAIERALAEGESIAQEYVEPARLPVTLSDGSSDGTATVRVAPVLSPCLYGSEPGGCWARFFPDTDYSVVSVYGYGALENVVLAAEDRR